MDGVISIAARGDIVEVDGGTQRILSVWVGLCVGVGGRAVVAGY